MYKVSLKAARVNAELSTTEAAKQLGITRPTLHSWEIGKTSPRIEDLRKMCKLYNCPMDAIKL